MPLSTPDKLIARPSEPDFHDLHPRWSAWFDALDYLWTKRYKIALWGLAAMLLAIPASFRICKYPATVELMPPDSSSGGGLAQFALPTLMKSPGLAGLSGLAGDLLGIKSTGALWVRVLQSRTVEDRIIDRFNLRDYFGMQKYEAARLKLESRTTIVDDKKSGIISITFRDRHPDLAASIANAYVEELDHAMLQLSTSAARREREFIEQRLAEEKKTLDQAAQKFGQFSSNTMALDIPEQTRVMVEASARLQGELIAARSELEGLQQIYTPENTRVKTVQARVHELERELANINTGTKGGVQKSATNPYPSIKNLPLVGLQWTDLYRDTKIHETVYELLNQQYEVARIQEARELPAVKVLDKAVPPENRRPGIPFVVLLATLGGMLLAISGLLIQHMWRSWDPADPRRVLLATAWPWRKKRGES
jgi:capsule polysaccharide export protein KpsE/RkpR